MKKEIVIPLLKKWRNKIEKMEIELQYCNDHKFELEAKRIHSNMITLIRCKTDLQDSFGMIKPEFDFDDFYKD